MIRFAETEPLFVPGQLVLHARYGYRGVVVAVDLRCRAGASWYLANRTQPDQNQPWYHVLVDGGQTTYAAQCNLSEDPSGDPIDHPLLSQFFTGMLSGRYLRNERQWPGW